MTSRICGADRGRRNAEPRRKLSGADDTFFFAQKASGEPE
jgi:hypothetical protein